MDRTLIQPGPAGPIGLRLRRHRRQRSGGRAHQRRPAQRARQRALRQASVDQNDRHAGALRLKLQIRPDFGFQQNQDRRAHPSQKAAHCPRQVVWKVALGDPPGERLQHRQRGLAPGRRHVGQHELRMRVAPRETLDQRLRCARFADRHRVQP